MSLALLRQQLAEVVEATRPGTPGLATGIAALDAALPNGGLPRGRLTEMVGPPGSGKTTLVRRMVAQAVAGGWWVAYVDATRTLAPRDWAHVRLERREACGVSGGVTRGADEGLWVVRPDTPARGAWCADVLLRSSAFALVVLDGAPVLARGVAVRLTRLAREADAALLVLGDDAKASELAGALRLRVVRQTLKQQHGIGDAAALTARRITVVIEKGGPYRTINAGAVDRGIAVARRVRAHPEVPDRRGVARQQKREPITGKATGRTTSVRINARSRRCAEPRIPDEPFLVDSAARGHLE